MSEQHVLGGSKGEQPRRLGMVPWQAAAVIQQPGQYREASGRLRLGTLQGPAQGFGRTAGDSIAGGMAPREFGLGIAVSAQCHALQFQWRKAGPEILGTAKQFAPLSGTALNQRALQRATKKTQQGTCGQRNQGLRHVVQGNRAMTLTIAQSSHYKAPSSARLAYKIYR